MQAVIYARYSSHSQTEQSIEGQLKVCRKYAQDNGIRVVGQYIDEAMTGTNDKRPEFQRMIRDSKSGYFDTVIVYQLDRFSRGIDDSTKYEKILKNNGVIVLSTTEQFADTPAGRFMRHIAFANNQYYSEELALKIKRGLTINADKCEYTGGGKAFGYKKASDGNRLIPNENTAPYVRKIFEMYAAGKTIADIARYLNGLGIKTSAGKAFNKSSFMGILSNKRYIGIYTFKGTEKPCESLRIIDDDLFYKVQKIKNKNKAAPARKRAKEEYLLTPRLFCGYCHNLMIGYGGQSGTSKKYYQYYNCKKAKIGECRKEKIPKQYIEDLVVNKCREILTKENIDKIAKEVVAADKNDNKNLQLKTLKKKQNDLEKGIENLFNALEQGQAADVITERIQNKRAELAEIVTQIKKEENNQVSLTEDEIKFFLTKLKRFDTTNKVNRKILVNVLVNAVYLYDDRITYVMNVGERTVEITEGLLADIRANSPLFFESSTIDELAPPKPPIYSGYSKFLLYVGGLFLFLAKNFI